MFCRAAQAGLRSKSTNSTRTGCGPRWGLRFSAGPCHSRVPPHTALTTTRQILDVLGVDVDQLRSEPHSLHDPPDGCRAIVGSGARVPVGRHFPTSSMRTSSIHAVASPKTLMPMLMRSASLPTS